MDFVSCIKKFVRESGVEKIASRVFIGILSDSQAFDDEARPFKMILSHWIDNGKLEKISKMSSKDSQWRLTVSDIIYQSKSEGFDKDIVSDLLHKLLLGIGVIDSSFDWEKEFSQQKPTTTNIGNNISNTTQKSAEAKRNPSTSVSSTTTATGSSSTPSVQASQKKQQSQVVTSNQQNTNHPQKPRHIVPLLIALAAVIVLLVVLVRKPHNSANKAQKVCTRIEVEIDTLKVGAEKGTSKIAFASDSPLVQVDVLSSWCSVKKSKDRININWDKNKTESVRSTVVTLQADSVSNKIVVIQSASISESPKNSSITETVLRDVESSSENTKKDEKKKISADISRIEYNNWAVDSYGMRALSATFNVSIKNWTSESQVYAVLRPFIGKRPMKIIEEGYSFNGYCASVQKISGEELQITCNLPYCEMEAIPESINRIGNVALTDAEDLYVLVSVYEIVGDQIRLLTESKKKKIEKPEVYVPNLWVEKDVMYEGQLYYAIHCDLDIKNRKGENFSCCYYIMDKKSSKVIDSGQCLLETNRKSQVFPDLILFTSKNVVLKEIKKGNYSSLCVFVNIFGQSGELLNTSTILDFVP